MVEDFTTAAFLLLVLAAGLELGFRVGRRSVGGGEPAGGGQLGAIQGAVLGLLGLLLGFSFGGAASRFMERQDLVLQEANAIGTAYLRADMLDEPHRSDLRTSLARYVAHRLELSATLRHGLKPEAKGEISQLHDEIWRAASQGARARPATMEVVLPPVNEVIDLHSSRMAAGRKHLPVLVMGLLILCSALAMGVIGYGCGLSGRRNLLMTGSLAILIAASLWTTIDLDRPRAGLIQTSDAPLRELQFGARG